MHVFVYSKPSKGLGYFDPYSEPVRVDHLGILPGCLQSIEIPYKGLLRQGAYDRFNDSEVTHYAFDGKAIIGLDVDTSTSPPSITDLNGFKHPTILHTSFGRYWEPVIADQRYDGDGNLVAFRYHGFLWDWSPDSLIAAPIAGDFSFYSKPGLEVQVWGLKAINTKYIYTDTEGYMSYDSISPGNASGFRFSEVSSASDAIARLLEFVMKACAMYFTTPARPSTTQDAGALNVINSSLDENTIRLRCETAVNEFRKRLLTLRDYRDSIFIRKGLIAQQLANSAKVIDTNLVALVTELINIRSEVSKLASSLTEAVATHGMKEIGSAYLTYSWGPLLTAKDLGAQIASVLDSMGQSRDYATDYASLSNSFITRIGIQSVSFSSTLTTKVRYNPHPFQKGSDVIDSLYRLSLVPSLTVAWDLTPFSFLVDWVTNVGDLAESIDARGAVSSLAVESILTSEKIATSEIDLSFADCYLDGHITLYDRYHEAGLTLPTLPQLQSNLGRFSNFAEAAALIVVHK